VRDTQSVGQLTIIEGTAEHEHFGSSFSIGRPFGLSGPIMLAVGRDSVGGCYSQLVLVWSCFHKIRRE